MRSPNGHDHEPVDTEPTSPVLADIQPQPPSPSLKIILYIRDLETDREGGGVCVLTPSGLDCELLTDPTIPAHFAVEQPAANVFTALLAARHAETDAREQR